MDNSTGAIAFLLIVYIALIMCRVYNGKMVQRVTYRRRLSYNTTSNRRRMYVLFITRSTAHVCRGYILNIYREMWCYHLTFLFLLPTLPCSVKTPGGQLTYQYVQKPASKPKCGDCGTVLQGVPSLRPKEYARISKCKKNVTRPYGGSRCAHCVRERCVVARV